MYFCINSNYGDWFYNVLDVYLVIIVLSLLFLFVVVVVVVVVVILLCLVVFWFLVGFDCNFLLVFYVVKYLGVVV